MSFCMQEWARKVGAGSMLCSLHARYSVFHLRGKNEPKKSRMLFLRLGSLRIFSSKTMSCLFRQTFQKNYKSKHSLKTYMWSQPIFPQSQKASVSLLIAKAFYYVLMSNKILDIILTGSILKKNCEDKYLI